MPKEKKNPNPHQFALLIWDLFRGEKTNEKTSLLRENKIVYEYVPNNMTADFQVFDLIVSKRCLPSSKTLQSRGFRKVFNVCTESHLSNFEVG